MNIVLAINKPEGWTSFDVVKKISRALKVKAGHSGTLDPMATGVMLVALEKATKLVPYLMTGKKTYVAQITFGIATDSKDITGKIINQQSVCTIDDKLAKQVVASLIKKQHQQVPKVSAVKVDGKRLYQHTEDVSLPIREIEVFDAKIINIEANRMTYEATVSKGTYIRVLSETIAERLNTIGTTSKLTRISNNNVSIDDTQSIEEAITNPKAYPMRELLANYPIIDIDDPTFIVHGKTIELDIVEDRVCFFYNNQPMAMYIRKEDKTFKSERGLF
jgi:tRNA pseudouridine55 synthase